MRRMTEIVGMSQVGGGAIYTSTRGRSVTGRAMVDVRSRIRVIIDFLQRVGMCVRGGWDREGRRRGGRGGTGGDRDG